MNALSLLLAEVRYRKLNFALSLLAVAIAVALFVAGPMLVEGYQRETEAQVAQAETATAEELDRLADQTRRLMRDMGFNLLITHRDTDMSEYWAADFAAADMPQQYVDRLAGDRRLTLVTHIVGTLQDRIDWNGRHAVLVGYAPSATQAHLRQKAPMGYRIEPGTVFLGHALGKDRAEGDKIEVLGREWRIARLLPEQGSKEDVTVAMHLRDAQELLGKSDPPRINQILALGCLCPDTPADMQLAAIRRQLETVLPEAQITEFRSIALARAKQRVAVADQRAAILAEMKSSRARIQEIMETAAGVLTPLAIVVAGVWVGLLALADVRERRTEIGILRALGKGAGTIASLFLGKAVLLGALGAAVGLGLGIAAACWFGARALEVDAARLHPQLGILLAALLGAPLLAALASYLPTLSAVMQDPAVVLRDH
jgi:putative ABC transport system permease protein